MPNISKTQILRDEHFDTLRNEFNKRYRAHFVNDHRNLKAAIHKCQHKAYTNESLINYEDAEAEAQKCFLPLLLVRRHAQVIMDNANTNLVSCFADKEEEYNLNAKSRRDELDAQKLKCFNLYQDELMGHKELIQSMYLGYLKNYQKTDGKLIDPKKLVKEGAEIKKVSKMVEDGQYRDVI